MGINLDVRELVVQTQSTSAAHESEDRLSPSQLLEIYQLDETKAEPEPSFIIIFDDMLTAGSHFRAMHATLGQRFPSAEIVGLFIARRAATADVI